MEGLQDLLINMNNHSGWGGKDIRKGYDNLVSMERELPRVDYNRLESIRAYLKVFEDKLAQSGPLLITLTENTSGEQNGKDTTRG